MFKCVQVYVSVLLSKSIGKCKNVDEQVVLYRGKGAVTFLHNHWSDKDS